MSRLVLSLLLILLLIPLAGCASSEDARLGAWSRRFERSVAELDAERARLARAVELPRRYDFPGRGTVVLRRLELAGWPGREYVRAELTFFNDSARTLPTPRVVLSIVDPASGERVDGWVDLEMPLGRGFTSGSSYSTWLDVETLGLHRRPGWTWELDVLLEAADEE